MYGKFEELTIDRPVEGVLRITLDGPDLHAVGSQKHAEIADVWTSIARDNSVRAVLVRGAGDKAFSSGGSFEFVSNIIDDWSHRTRALREARDLVRNLIDLPQPLVSAINGPAVGAGLVVAMLSDISVAGKRAKIVDGHVRLGVAAGDNAALTWPLFAGMPKAKYHLLLNEVLTGEDAERMGMVSLAVDDSEVQEAALKIAERLSAGSASAIQNTKHALNNWYRQHWTVFDASLLYEFYGFGGPDAKEGLASHRDKRAPVFNRTTSTSDE